MDSMPWYVGSCEHAGMSRGAPIATTHIVVGSASYLQEAQSRYLGQVAHDDIAGPGTSVDDGPGQISARNPPSSGAGPGEQQFSACRQNKQPG